MQADQWSTKPIPVSHLFLDAHNPRLGSGGPSYSPREILRFLFEHDKAFEIAKSIAVRGFFPNEPLLATKENGRLTVIEGNRRLAALKALADPDLLENPFKTQLQKLRLRMTDLKAISRVPVTIAPDRRSTDKQVSGRHVGTPVLPWQAEDRANFILNKLSEGYTNEELRIELNFTEADIQKARQTKAVASMARSLPLSKDIKEKLNDPRSRIFTTLERVLESTIGRKYLMIETDAEHGFKGKTSKSEFIKGFSRLVRDIASKDESSRTLNDKASIEAYFRKWKPDELPAKRPESFIPSQLITEESSQTNSPSQKPSKSQRAIKTSTTVIPKAFKVQYGGERLKDIRDELVKIERDALTNAGAVLLRVFLELTILDYLKRTGHLAALEKQLHLDSKDRYDVPEMKYLKKEILKIAERRLHPTHHKMVAKALQKDPHAPFSLDDLHSFVHNPEDFPDPGAIRNFWKRTEPLFMMMLQEPPEMIQNESS